MLGPGDRPTLSPALRRALGRAVVLALANVLGPKGNTRSSDARRCPAP